MVAEAFKQIFGAEPEQTAAAPGRVNLIGEHIDYNGGMVLPMALPIGLVAAIRRRDDNLIRIASERFDKIEERELGGAKTGSWADYGAGAIEFLTHVGGRRAGVDVLVQSAIPDGAGLSSSAALIVAILKAARDLAQSPATDTEIAVIARRVENEFIGMPCGIMDQMAVSVATQGEAIALDTESLEFETIPLTDQHHFAVTHSGQHRKLSDGRYAERKRECDVAKAAAGREDLCLLTDQEVESLMVAPAVKRRARHCVSEHRRVLKAVSALKAGDASAFGALMNESHVSMRDDFEMSTPEIDGLVADSVSAGAIGARLTGGGFGGCIVSLVAKANLTAWRDEVSARRPSSKQIC